MTRCFLLISLAAWFQSSTSLRITETPPLLDVPTYSLATVGPNDGTTGMNILTYATPVSATPERLWSIGLFKGTVAHENFCRSGSGVLQLLRPHHSKLVRLLGGASGRDVDKREECSKLGFPWMRCSDMDSDEEDWPYLLPGCAYYIKLKLCEGLIDAGGHDVAICRVESMFVDDDDPELREGNAPYLSTGALRQSGIISELGRVVVPWETN